MGEKGESGTRGEPGLTGPKGRPVSLRDLVLLYIQVMDVLFRVQWVWRVRRVKEGLRELLVLPGHRGRREWRGERE